MKTVKPQKLGVLCRPFDDGETCRFAIGILAFFNLEQPETLLSEQAMWPFVAKQLGKDGALDAGMPKPSGEVLMTGAAFAPHGKPQPAVSVRVKVGTVDKTLTAIGNRTWRADGTATQPEPFVTMPLGWDNAFGGEGYPTNPLGKGFARIEGPRGPVHPLPNVEDPRHPVRAPKDRPTPVGFGAIDIAWPQRARKAGTYDARWQKTRFPGFAEDMDWSYFNTASSDQFIKGYFHGGEAFVLEHLHPERPTIEGTLPTLQGRAFITQRTANGDVFREVPTALETVHLFPNAARGVLIYRGMTDIAEDDGADVIHLLVACEQFGAPRPAEHYRDVLARRLDRVNGPVAALNESDLVPPMPPPVASEQEIADAPEMREFLGAKNARRRQEREIAAANERLAALAATPAARAAGVDPAKMVIPPPAPAEPPPAIEDIPAVVEKAKADAAEQRRASEQKMEEALAKIRPLVAKQGKDLDKVMADASTGQGGPPKFTADVELARLRKTAAHARSVGRPLVELETKLASPELEQMLRANERQVRDAYRISAQHGPSAPLLSPDANARVRAEVERIAQTTRTFTDMDLTGADLSGLDLRGSDFRSALMECVRLAGSDLSSADLTGAVLVRADLTDANLTRANLTSTNFGRAILHRCRLVEANLRTAVFHDADARTAMFTGSTLEKTDFLGTVFGETDFSSVNARGVFFLKAGLGTTRWTAAQLTQCLFIECNLESADFSSATLPKCIFITALGTGANFAGANLTNLRVVKESNFEGSNFAGATLEGANLRGSRLAGCNFSNARLPSADLSECDLRRAVFHRAFAREARFDRADLSEALMVSIDLLMGSLQKARLDGANFLGANLFRVDMARVKLDTATRFDEANLLQARVTPPRRSHGP